MKIKNLTLFKVILLVFFIFPIKGLSFDLYTLTPDVPDTQNYIISAGAGIVNFQGGGGYVYPLTGIDLAVKGSVGFLYNFKEKGGGIGFSGVAIQEILKDTWAIPFDLSWFSGLFFDFLNIKVVVGGLGGISLGKSLYSVDGKIIFTSYINAGLALRYREEWYVNDRDLDPDFYGGLGFRLSFSKGWFISLEARFTEKFFVLLSFSKER